MKSLALASLLALAALAGCGGDGGGDGASAPSGPLELTAAEAAETDYEGPAIVEGIVLLVEDEMRTCELIAESFPPQCGGGSVLVEGIEAAYVPRIVEIDGVWWTDQAVQLEGILSEGVLTVSDIAQR